MEKQAERPAPNEDRDDREPWWQLAAAIILSAATLASAWCGFQASSWSSEYATQSRAASAERIEMARQSAMADRQILSDLSIFLTWVEAEITGAEDVAAEVEYRFTPGFVPAFEAWLAQPTGTAGDLPTGSPFDLPEYAPPSQAAADAAEARAVEATQAADEAASHSSRYVLATVLFASVLFLAGIAAKLTVVRLAHGVVVVAGFTLAAAILMLAALPLHLGGI